MAIARRAVDLGRTLRGQAGLGSASRWPSVAGAARTRGARRRTRDDAARALADELNVKQVAVIGDESELVERRVKPLLPKIGKRLGAAIPAVMAAARDNAVEYPPGRLGDAGRRDAGAGRGRDPGHAPPGHGGGRTTRAWWWSSTPS